MMQQSGMALLGGVIVDLLLCGMLHRVLSAADGRLCA